MYIGLHVKYPLFLSDFKEIWSFFFDIFSQNIQISDLIKIRPVGVELFNEGRRTDRQIWRSL